MNNINKILFFIILLGFGLFLTYAGYRITFHNDFKMFKDYKTAKFNISKAISKGHIILFNGIVLILLSIMFIIWADSRFIIWILICFVIFMFSIDAYLNFKYEK